mgnify:FL=1
MMEGILGAIANPQLADVAGALDYRRAQMDKDEAKRKDLRMNQLIAQAIPNMAADSPVRKIFEEDPKTGAMLSKMIGIPLNDGEAWEKFRGNVAQLHSLAKADPRMAIERANAIKAENDRLGIVDEPLNKWVGAINSAMEKGDQDGIVTQFNALGVMNDNLNPVKADVISAEKQAELDLKREEFEWKKANPNAGVAGGLSPKDVVMTPNGAYVFDKRTGGFSKGLDESGNPIIGANYDPTLKRNLSSAGAEGAATGKDIVDYKGKLFDSINSGARTLNKYNFAINQIDKGAESGPVMKLLPNLKEQTILVDVIRKEIGMEILGSGALGVNPTDKDVTLAMDSAIPENLSPKALKAELQRRASVLQDLNAAQEKYYELIESGKTKGDILKMAKAKREEEKQQDQQSGANGEWSIRPAGGQ